MRRPEGRVAVVNVSRSQGRPAALMPPPSLVARKIATVIETRLIGRISGRLSG